MPDQKPDLVHAGLRLAIRKEGTTVSAYLARQDSMLGAEMLGHIKTEACQADPELFELFRRLMQCTAGALIKKRTGITPQWPNPPAPAPEHERGGNA